MIHSKAHFRDDNNAQHHYDANNVYLFRSLRKCVPSLK